MKRALITFIASLLLFDLTVAAGTQTVFHGNREFSSKELAQFLELPPDRLLPPDSLSLRLTALADSMIVRDFIFARVDSSGESMNRKGKPRLDVFVHEGGLARISSVQWLGDSLRVPHSVAARALTRAGTVFRWSNLEFDANLFLDYFENAGYPFAQVSLKDLTVDSLTRGVDVILTIKSGPVTAVDFLTFPGAKLTKETFLRRETRLHIGEAYSQRHVDVAQRRLSRFDFLRHVDKGQIATNDAGQTGVRFPIEESHSTRLDIAAGYLPPSGGRPAVLSGLVNIEFLNLFGAGRRAMLHWERPDQKIQSVNLAYREPWIFGQPLALRFDFGQRIEDTLYVTRQIAARAELELTSSLLAWGSVEQQGIFSDSLAATTTYLESGFTYDTRDHPLNPRGGGMFSTQIATGWRQRSRTPVGEPTGSFRHQRGGMDAEVAQEVFPFWIADVSVHARAIETTEPEVLDPDLFRLGGARTLRGYREEQFRGSRIGWASFEMRYWLGPASRVFGFADAGGVYRQQHINSVLQTTTLFRPAAGVGLRLETDLGVWGFDYGIGQGDNLLGGKLHVSLLSTF